MSLAIVHSRAQVGVEAPCVSVEAHLANGLPSLTLVGLPETAVRESKDRVRSALLNAGFDFPARRITLNLAPADLPKDGGIHSGLPVEMLFTAFNQSKTPRVTGEVTMVSADRLLDEQNKQPYYALRAQVDAAAMGKLKGLQIRPGMAVQVFVRTGERSLLNYLFKPLFDRAHVALAEN